MQIQPRQTQTYQLRGINLSDEYIEGSMSDCLNMSTRRFPFFSTRRGREELKGSPYPAGGFTNVIGMTAWNKLVVLSTKNFSTDPATDAPEGKAYIYYDGVLVKAQTGDDPGLVSDSPKKFAVVNTKLVIMPDKKYIDLNVQRLVDMQVEINISNTITVGSPSVEDPYQTITISNGYSTYKSQFDKLEKDDWVILNLSGGSNVTDLYVCFVEATQSSNNLVVTFKRNPTIQSGTYTSGSVERHIPDFDYICGADNRLWGCVNSEQTIYVSALGDPNMFYDYEGTGSSSWAVAVTSEGVFSGCIKLGSSVLFFKEYCLHKVVGGNPTEYMMYTYVMEGVRAGCDETMQVINETLFYLGINGVFVFSGGTPSNISSQLGDKELLEGVAGTDGKNYYLSCKEGDRRHLFVYSMKEGMWVREDDSKVDYFTRNNNDLLMVVNGRIYINDTGEFGNTDWYIKFNDIRENTYKRGSLAGGELNKKKYSKLILRAEMPKGSYCTVKISCDNGRWEQVGRILGSFENVTRIVLPLNRCDKFGLQLEGKGDFTLMNLSRVYTTGSDRNE